jgi:hypothetical protein
MKTLTAFALAALTLVAVPERMACAQADVPGVPPQAAAAGYDRLVFSEDFDSLDLSPDGGGNHKWYNGLWYRDPVDPDRFTIQDGYLRATTQMTPMDGTPMSFLTTWPRKRGAGRPRLFQFGYFEARIRFAPGPFNWPAFWLLARDRTRNDGKGGKGRWCEIDIFEGGRQRYFQGTVHDWRDNVSTDNPNQHQMLADTEDLSQWNVVGALWEPGKISWFFNNRLLHTAPSPSVCDEQKLFLIVGAQKRAFGPLPTSVDVDWVHVYR